ncbi:hypothetical protein Syun_014601 [Stephania yunnanensis]|uniref:Uncharacterized protein n=1 Tax=Stephania yunnanensis TaxID=152371 RepID=A0AAP0JKR0_9MAGN
MDNDDLRRGKPTNHKVYGEDLAVWRATPSRSPSPSPEHVADATERRLPGQNRPRNRGASESDRHRRVGGGRVVDIRSEGPDAGRRGLSAAFLLFRVVIVVVVAQGGRRANDEVVEVVKNEDRRLFFWF